jgi:hypothetical protein
MRRFVALTSAATTNTNIQSSVYEGCQLMLILDECMTNDELR